MRQIGNEDLFKFIRIIKDAGITEQFKQLILSKDSIKDFNVESVGFDVIFMVLEGAAKEGISDQVYDFGADLLEVSGDDFKRMDPIDTFEQLKQCASWEKWKAFFTLGAKSMK